MEQTPFHAYYTAQKLLSLSAEDGLIPVFASSNIEIYPFQIAAAHFGLRSPYQKGFILCDEAGMGKSHEAMMIIVQRWYEGHKHILLCIPNADLLQQWLNLLDKYYTIPYINAEMIMQNEEMGNPFLQDGLIIATYDFVINNANLAREVAWDVTVFEEATALVNVYKEDNIKAKSLKETAAKSTKILLTGTPIEKNIMDLYGLIYFIDETVLPSEQVFLQRYLRRPENYPELANRVSKFCFRTLRSQAKQYAKIPLRLPVTYEYELSQPEQELYHKLFAYCNQEHKFAFPDMDNYDLSLRILGLLSSSTAAACQTLEGIIRRLQGFNAAENELAELTQIQELAASITIDAKTEALLAALPKLFALLKKSGAKKKALIFTESLATQQYLYPLLAAKYRTAVYNGSQDYADLQAFKQDAEILISTDHGARGFDLSDTSLIIHYDLPYNTLKMEQRIVRAQRIGQQNDIISLAFINPHNFADVRKLELINKRTLVSGGVMGISDDIIGAFSDNLEQALVELGQNLRNKAQVEEDYQHTLSKYEAANKHVIAAAEDILFTTFSKKLADKIKISPDYIHNRAEQLNADLWQLAKWFFNEYNQQNDDCHFVIDEEKQTITATDYQNLPALFYYWSGNRNKKYFAQKQYGMAQDFKPRHGRISLTSIIGQGIINEISCAEYGQIAVKHQDIKDNYTIGLYNGEIYDQNKFIRKLTVLVGRSAKGQVLNEQECQTLLKLAVLSYEQEGRSIPAWLRSEAKYHILDNLIDRQALLDEQKGHLSEAQKEEADRLKLAHMTAKSAVNKQLKDLQIEVESLEKELLALNGDRLQSLLKQRELNSKRLILKQQEEQEFFAKMELELQAERQIEEFLGQDGLRLELRRQFVLEVKNEFD